MKKKELDEERPDEAPTGTLNPTRTAVVVMERNKEGGGDKLRRKMWNCFCEKSPGKKCLLIIILLTYL